MDRSFSSSSRPGAWPSAPRRGPALSMKSRAPALGSSRLSMSGRSTQSAQVVSKTPYHVIETYGVSLPVLVTEALTFADRSTAVSVHISPDGWAWLVCGRRLLIWQYKQSIEALRQRKAFSNPCRELTLPPSELAHRADLVWVYTPEGSQVPACLAVSPEGSVRFWPSIAYEGTSVEETIDLQGQECDSLVSLAPLGCMLATTTSSIVLLQPQISGGRHCVTSHALKPPQSLLKGFGRRMSSLIFGSIPSAGAVEAKLVRVTVVDETATSGDSHEWSVYVLTEHSLQRWIISQHELGRLLFECDVITRVRQAFHDSVWASTGSRVEDEECWLLDMQPTQGGVTMLTASRKNADFLQDIRFALVVVVTDPSGTQPIKLDNFIPLKNLPLLYAGEQELAQYRLLIAGPAALIYDPHDIVVYPVSTMPEDPDFIEVSRNSSAEKPDKMDKILGGAVCANVPVFFSRIHGLVSVTPSDSCLNDMLNGSVMSQNETLALADVSMAESANISMAEQDFDELTSRQDAYSCLKAAFFSHVSKKQSQCEMLLRDFFPRLSQPLSDVDNQLDLLVVKVARDLIDDIPSKDPRWVDVKGTGMGLSTSTSLQIIRQLKQKKHALDLFLDFLKEMKLWERLCAITSFGVIMYTTHVLAEQAEKAVAAIALRQLQADYANLIETAIKTVLSQQHVNLSGGLTYQDLFYCEVSSVHRALQMMVKMCDQEVHSERPPTEVANIIADTNKVVLAVLVEAIQYRQSKAQAFAPVNILDPGVTEYVPWTAAVGSHGLREALLTQRTITLKYGARATGDPKLKTLLYDHLLNLVDVLLDGSKCHLESLRGSDKMAILAQQYQQERTQFIEPFVEDQEYERATELAEKYCDFHTLVKICDLTENKERLNSYVEKFADKDFSQFLFGWYIQEQKPARLLQTALQDNARLQRGLSRFLADHPSLSWIQNIFQRNFAQAAETLSALAVDETDLVDRKKSMLSLSKLSYLASGYSLNDPEGNQLGCGDYQLQISAIDAQLNLISYQEDLPDEVLQAHGCDQDNVCVFTPSELIRLYICEENKKADEITFKKALEISDYIEDELEQSEWRHKIWCRAILCDNWVDADNSVPIQVVQETVFFRLVLLIDMNDEDLTKAVPPRESLLTAPELGDLVNSNSFKYLLLVAYETIERLNKGYD